MLAETFASFIFFIVVAEATTSQYKWIDDVGACKLHYLPAAWQEARLRCEHEGSVLASSMKPGLLTPLMKEFGRQQVFLGIHTAMTGEYYSIDGTALDSISVEWAPNEPNNFDDSESCLALHSNGTVADVKCSQHLPYICCKDTKNAENRRLFYTIDNYISNMKKNSIEEKPQEWTYDYLSSTGSPLEQKDNYISYWKSPTFKEGTEDSYISSTALPSFNQKVSTDNYIRGTGSHLEQEDDYISYWESPAFEEKTVVSEDSYIISTALPSFNQKVSTDDYISSTVPSSSEEKVSNDKTSDGYECDKSVGSCYKVHTIESTWSQAHNACIADSAQLLIVNSQQEAKYLSDWAYRTLDLYPSLYYVYSIGYRATGDQRTWMTIDGQPLSELDFLAWDYEHTDNTTRFFDNGDNCGSIVINDNSCYFQSNSCDGTKFFICEKKMVQVEDTPEVEPTTETLDEYEVYQMKTDIDPMSDEN